MNDRDFMKLSLNKKLLHMKKGMNTMIWFIYALFVLLVLFITGMNTI